MNNNCHRKYTEINMQHNCPLMNNLYRYPMTCPMMCPMVRMQMMGFSGQIAGQFNTIPDFQGVQPFGMYPDMAGIEGMQAPNPYKCQCAHKENPQQYSVNTNISSENGQSSSFDSAGEETVEDRNVNISYPMDQDLWQGNIENIKMRTVDISEIED